jgi:hypothetical protein
MTVRELIEQLQDLGPEAADDRIQISSLEYDMEIIRVSADRERPSAKHLDENVVVFEVD